MQLIGRSLISKLQNLPKNKSKIRYNNYMTRLGNSSRNWIISNNTRANK